MPAHPPVSVDRTSPVPLYFQVAQQYEQAIIAGTLAPGDRLDNEIALADAIGVSRITMRQAISILVEKGMLARRRGVGTQVVSGRLRRSLELTSLYEDLDRAGQSPRTTVLALEQRPADDESARELQVEPGTPTWWLERLRFAGEEPLAIMRNRLPVDSVDLTGIDLESGGLYAHLRRAGVTLAVAQQTIGARRATAAEAALLTEKRGAPLLTLNRTSYDHTGRAVEFGQHAYRPSLHSFNLSVVER